MSTVVRRRIDPAYGVHCVVERISAEGEEIRERTLVFVKDFRQLSARVFTWCRCVEESHRQTRGAGETGHDEKKNQPSNHASSEIPVVPDSLIGGMGADLQTLRSEFRFRDKLDP